MESYRTRVVIGIALMGLGFLAELVMLTGMLIPQRPPAAVWGLFLLVGVGAGVLASAFVAAARDRRRRTREAVAAPQAAKPHG